MSSVEEAWSKILATLTDEPMHFGRSGYLPLYDESSGDWIVIQNVFTIYPGAENCADPVKVDLLRRYVSTFLERFSETETQLAKLGVEVKSLVKNPIQTYEDVCAWAESIFNSGPVAQLPKHVRDTIDLAYDDVIIEVKSGRNPVYVIPASPRGSSDRSTLNFARPGLKGRFGPRHEYSKAAFQKQVVEKAPKPPRYRGTTGDGEPRRPRGRPRKDGLAPGSTEAKEADEKREQERRQAIAERLAARKAHRKKTALAPRPKKLVRIGKKKVAS